MSSSLEAGIKDFILKLTRLILRINRPSSSSDSAQQLARQLTRSLLSLEATDRHFEVFWLFLPSVSVSVSVFWMFVFVDCSIVVRAFPL
jgi:hypothetical protein